MFTLLVFCFLVCKSVFLLVHSFLKAGCLFAAFLSFSFSVLFFVVGWLTPFYFFIILYVNCFGRTMLYMCTEYHTIYPHNQSALHIPTQPVSITYTHTTNQYTHTTNQYYIYPHNQSVLHTPPQPVSITYTHTTNEYYIYTHNQSAVHIPTQPISITYTHTTSQYYIYPHSQSVLHIPT